MDCCISVADVASRRHLRSARRHRLVVPRLTITLTLALSLSLTLNLNLVILRM